MLATGEKKRSLWRMNKVVCLFCICQVSDSLKTCNYILISRSVEKKKNLSLLTAFFLVTSDQMSTGRNLVESFSQH